MTLKDAVYIRMTGYSTHNKNSISLEDYLEACDVFAKNRNSCLKTVGIEEKKKKEEENVK